MEVHSNGKVCHGILSTDLRRTRAASSYRPAYSNLAREVVVATHTVVFKYIQKGTRIDIKWVRSHNWL